MTSHALVIEQMFEDLPSRDSSYASSTASGFAPFLGSFKSKTTDGSKPRKAATTNATTTSKSKATTSSSTTSVSSSVASTISARRRTRLGRMSGQASEKMTPSLALAVFSSKLTPYEREEIKGFSEIYYLGLQAKKLGSPDQILPAKKPADFFDDDEHFYRVVPHDHINYRFEVVDRPHLGKGTFGEVIKAFDHKEQRYVALKIVRNEKIYLKQSREELRILQDLRKQDAYGTYSIVSMNEFFIFRNHMVISFELLGMNLYQVLKSNRFRGLPIAQIRPIARGTLKCLELLFKNRIIHCDLKPENIMLRRNGDFRNIRVGDFGSSCYEQQQMYKYIQSRYYRAPEVILGMRYGTAIDMWSFGCVLGELSTGNPIFVGVDEFDQLAAIEEYIGEVPPGMAVRQKIKSRPARRRERGAPGTRTLVKVLHGDANFKDFTEKVLEMDPERRPTPSEMLEHPFMVVTKPVLGHGVSASRIVKRESIVIGKEEKEKEKDTDI